MTMIANGAKMLMLENVSSDQTNHDEAMSN